jgi:hypothetical protein
MFRTELTIAPQERLLPRTARVLTVGSCFADSIGERLRLNKVNALVNPFGTVFQPLALAQLLRAAAGEEQDWQQHVVEARGRWQSYDFHSTIGAESPVELLQTIQDTVRRVGEFVRAADAVVLTLGTAWAYRLRETGELVSNLHKLPAGLFDKELLTADEIVNGLAEVHALLRRLNPAIRIVLTVSPVRHIKDTLPLNAVSKSVLRVACHYLSELLPNISYFPAYELLTDDLRDYRFYAADMLHPSEVAEDYIWERFARTYFDADFGRFRKEWTAVRQALGHRPLHPGAPEHRTFLDQTRERLERLAAQGVDVRQELRDVQRQLVALPPPRPVHVPVVEPEDDEERIDIGGETPTESLATSGSSGEQAANPTTRYERRQDNRRDGRRNERPTRDRHTNRPQAVTEVTTSEDLTFKETTAPEQLEIATVDMPAVAETVATEEATYPAKKKKRRSRGGAKRTARKNAARLATDQGDSEETLSTVAETVEVEDSPSTEEDFSAQPPVEETAEQAPVFASDLADVQEEGFANNQLTPEELPVTAAQPTPTRKRGTGPTPKKSKVITKSGLLKRGQRNPLYRAAPPEPAAVVDPTPATAPIISPPIIPDVLLARPAAALEVFIEPEASAPITDEAPTVPVKTRRGRPKAKAAPDETPASTTPTEEATPTDTPRATEEPAEAPTKKTAARTSKPAKPKAKAPKETPKPAAPRRGRPPAKKTTPDAPDTPAA